MMPDPTFYLRLLTGMAATLISSCRTIPPVPDKPAAPVLYEWKGADLPGPVAVSIDLSEQKAAITRGGEDAGWTYVASGISGRRTPTGSFRITEKVEDKYSSSWGVIVDAEGNTVNRDAKNGRDAVPDNGEFVGAPMPFWMRFNGPFGMHAGFLPNPGQPASHGCVRLPREMAKILFGVTGIGTPVKIVP